MSRTHIILGVDERVDENGESHPWRIVAMGGPLPAGRAQYLMALPSDRRYYSPPRHPLYGDLTLIGTSASVQIAHMVCTLRDLTVSEVHLEAGLAAGTIGRTLIWNGIEPRGHRMRDVVEGMLRDTFSIGGNAGHQIAFIELEMRKTR